ncbi:hypothetical protein QBC39DRAFT_360739 [Podospora conica]|nr:hypothetical protein QBC39DRAFT_360739 [Schizothecium conicum]
MGLRLYQAPVESDIKPRSAAEKASAQARSSIRRPADRGGALAEARAAQDRRRRPWGYRRTENLLEGWARAHQFEPTSANTTQVNTERTPWSPEPESVASLESSSDDAPATRENGADDAQRGFNRGRLDDHIVALVGERWAQLHASAAAPGPSRDADDRQSVPPLPPLSSMALGPEFLASRRRPAVDVYATSSMRSTQAPGRWADHWAARPSASAQRSALPEGTWAERRARANASRSSYRRVDSEGNLVNRREQMERLRRAIESNTSFDGLGDRNRSLSPEGDHVWDTLLTTISPDPQPPSVGSSFASASASASATASQGAATGSSRTSFAGPVEVDELLASFEPQCESGCETSSDTEGDDEEYEMPQIIHLPYSRSYADVTRSTGGGSNDNIGGFQRIVMRLAQREDIPDEWWAEAGLSRTLSRDAPAH